MKSLKLALLCLFYVVSTNCQNTDGTVMVKPKPVLIPDSLTHNTEDMAKYIKGHYFTNTDKVRIIYTWITTNIRYDVENMYAINFYVKKEDMIDKALKTRIGICSNYALLFNDLCTKSGIKAYEIEGYTKQKGFVDYLPHAWNAALIDSIWYMFDATWGAGYVHNVKFYPEVNYKYFKMAPDEMIKTHMPFDYLWQFLYFPLSAQKFYSDSTEENMNADYFYFPDSINRYDMIPVIQQFRETCWRIEKNGVKNSLIYDRLQHLKREIETLKQNTNIMLYNSAGVDFNEGINYYNQFIDYRNKMFMPLKSDADIKRMIDAASNKLHEAKLKVARIKDPDANVSALIVSFNKLVEHTLSQVNEQQDFVRKYLSLPPENRKKMFYK